MRRNDRAEHIAMMRAVLEEEERRLQAQDRRAEQAGAKRGAKGEAKEVGKALASEARKIGRGIMRGLGL